jgi:hypothetical protein
MKLKRLITEAEYNTLITLSTKTDLQNDNKNHYYHAEKLTDNSDVQYINSLLNEVIDGFISFSNFRVNSDLIRLQYHYDIGFIGVGYITITELLNGFKEGN